MVILSAGAACCAAWAASAPALRSAMRLLAAGIAVTAAVLGSVTGCVAAALVLAGSLAARVRRRGVALAGLGVITAGAAGLTWAVAGGAVPEGFAASLEGRLTPHRVALWQDALGLARTHAGLGVGPGRFGELSAASLGSRRPTASRTRLRSSSRRNRVSSVWCCWRRCSAGCCTPCGAARARRRWR